MASPLYTFILLRCPEGITVENLRQIPGTLCWLVDVRTEYEMAYATAPELTRYGSSYKFPGCDLYR